MIITRTPLRISFCGGGTDLPGYANNHIGEVVSAAIDKCIYVTVNKKFDGRINLRYSKTENVSRVHEVEHSIVRACLEYLKISEGIEIVTISDVPMQGTGLGSSSSLTVGLLNALSAYKGDYLDAEELAEMACKIEIDILKSPIGKQDQYAAAYGGLNHFTFNKDGSVTRKDLYRDYTSIKVKLFEESMMLFHLDRPRQANTILRHQAKKIDDMKLEYDAIKHLTNDLLGWLSDGFNSHVLGEIIDSSWLHKKNLCGQISNGYIDNLYERAKKAGALGGKVCGAGGGGFMMLVVPLDHQSDVKRAFRPLNVMPIKFDEEGSRVVYHDS